MYTANQAILTLGDCLECLSCRCSTTFDSNECVNYLHFHIQSDRKSHLILHGINDKIITNVYKIMITLYTFEVHPHNTMCISVLNSLVTDFKVCLYSDVTAT